MTDIFNTGLYDLDTKKLNKYKEALDTLMEWEDFKNEFNEHGALEALKDMFEDEVGYRGI